jgi:glycosyltransferase involved in cell wall biosynthesis
MRVGLVGPYPLDPTRVEGGVHASFLSFLEGLTSFAEIEPHVLTIVPGATDIRRATHGSIPVAYLPGPERWNNVTLFRRGRQILKRAIDGLGLDLVHAQDALSYGYMCLRAVHDTPVVLSIHGIAREEARFHERRSDVLRAQVAASSLQKYCIRNAKYLLEPTRYPEEYFGNLIRGRIAEVGNAVGNPFFEAVPSAEPGRLLYAGEVIPLKRVLDLVDMVALVRPTVPDVRLHIAGSLEHTGYVSAVRSRAQEHGVTGQVALLGPLTRSEMVDEYRHASVLVHASAQENSPMAIAEAMAVGVPVVATDVGGVKSLIDDETTGFLVAVGDVFDMSRRVSSLLCDEPRREAFGRAARAVAERRFRSTEVARRVLAIYREMLSPAYEVAG